MNEVLFAFLITLFAGLSTSIGALLVFSTNTNNKKFLSAALGLSAGVMIYISFMEMLPTALEHFSTDYSEEKSQIIMILGFFGSMLVVGLLSHLIPEADEPHELMSQEEMEATYKDKELEKVGLKTALAMAAHNFPEGIATFMSAIIDPQLGVSIAIAIAIHNIPEGVGVAAPVYFSTGSKKKAFWATFLSGFTEPLGALVAYLVLMPFITDFIFGLTFSIVAGIMVLISFDELLPASRAYGEPHLSLIGLIIGMLIMAVSLVVL